MMHQLTIDPSSCRGTALCHACEAIKPGLFMHCHHYGRLLISHEHTASMQPLLSRLVATCPDRAIMVKPVVEP